MWPGSPQFLPWCDHTRVVQAHGDGMTAEIGLTLGSVHQMFTARNIHALHQVECVTGQGAVVWTGSGTFIFWAMDPEQYCKVELTLNYGFDNATLGKLVGPVFDKIAASLVDAFVKRAQQVYGD